MSKKQTKTKQSAKATKPKSKELRKATNAPQKTSALRFSERTW
jgi:hypothetical protein